MRKQKSLPHLDSRLFWCLAVILALLRLAFTADATVHMVYSPHDDGLYVSRAFHLLRGEAFGPYDARLLVKLPGLSLWLAGLRWLGIPYLLGSVTFYIAVGAYFIRALEHCGFSRIFLLLLYVLHLFNPVSLDHQCYRVLRESLSLNLMFLFFGAMIFLLQEAGRRVPWLHLAVLGAAFSASRLVREEDVLLAAPLALFALIWLWKANGSRWRGAWRPLRLLLVLSPFLCAWGTEAGLRRYIHRHYGAPLLHDFGEGEFPRLIAAMRGVRSARVNRHVSITQEALGKLRQAVPRLAPVIDHLPPPGPQTYSAVRFGVKTEWTSGYLFFWIKDEAFRAGLTPDLASGQAFFRNARMDIERAAAEGRLDWRKNGEGLIPPFDWRWLRDFLREGVLLMQMSLSSPVGLPGPPPPAYAVAADYGRMYQAVTMTHYFDSALHEENSYEAWRTQSQELYLALRYWLRYPDVAATRDFGPGIGSVARLGALEHYERHGKYEGRMLTPPGSGPRESVVTVQPPSWKQQWLDFYLRWDNVIETVFLAALLVRIFFLLCTPLDALEWTTLLFLALTLLRWTALAHVSVTMGTLDVRLMFSTYAGFILFGAAFSFRTARELVAQLHTPAAAPVAPPTLFSPPSP